MPTYTVALVRHASAGERETGIADALRPIDDEGLRQARALVPVLSALRPSRLISADVLRCEQTITPSAEALGLAITFEHLLSEDGYWNDTTTGMQVWRDIVGGGVSTAVSSQGGVIPSILERSFAEWGIASPDSFDTRKSDYWLVEMAAGRPSPIAVTKHSNPARTT